MAYDILRDGPPPHFEYFLPDDPTSECLVVMTPSKVNGAINFSETNPPLIGIYKPVVQGQRFRFKSIAGLIDLHVDSVNELIDETRPKAVQSRKMYSLTAGRVEIAPSTIGADVNFADAQMERKMLEANVSDIEVLKDGDVPRFEHNQKFDHLGKAIRLMYDTNGSVIEPAKSYVGEDTKAEQRMINQPVRDAAGNVVVNTYDAYGALVNGVTGTTVSVTIPATAVDKNGVKITSVYDVFGNRVVGLTTEKGLIVIPQKLPIKLDSVGRPIKKPVGLNFNLIGF